MTRMFRFHSRGQLPRHNNMDSTYILQSRNSIYCVHREITLSRDSSGATKSCILGFRFKEHAERMRLVLNQYQSKGRVVDGMVQGGIMNIDDSLQGRPISKLDIHPYKLVDIEKQCLMNYMDLWLVSDIARLLRDGEVEEDWRLDVYEYITLEPPHRSYINHQLERLLRDGKRY